VTLGPPSTTLGTPTAGPAGSFQFPFVVPAVPRGTYTVTATDSTGASASAEFTISSPISEISGTTQLITDIPDDQFNPAISGNIVTYTSLETGNANVFYYNLSNGTQTQVSYAPSPTEDTLSDVSGNTIVYATTAPFPEPAIQGYVIGGTSNPITISSAGLDEAATKPSINGSVVAWEQSDPSYTFQIFADNLSTGTTVDVTPSVNATQNAYDPQVSGNLVAYCEVSSAGSQVIVANLETLASTAVATGCSQLTGLDFSGDSVVYGYLDTSTSETNIGLYNLSTGTETSISPTPGYSYEDPHISGDWVSYDADEQNSSGAFSSIVLYNIPTGDYYVVAPGTNSSDSAFLSDVSVLDGIGRVAYTDDVSAGNQVYVFQFDALSAPAISASPATVYSGESATLSITAPPSDGATPYTCEWLVESPVSGSYRDLAPSDCSSTASTGALSTGLWSFELQVTDSIGASVTSSAATVLAAVGPATTTIPVPGTAFGVAVDPATNTVYTTDESNDVSVISGSTDSVTRVLPVGDDPQGIAVDPVTDTIYAVNYGSSNVSVINGSSGEVVGTVTIGGGTSGPVGIAVDPVTDRIYVGVVNGGLGGNVVVIDGATNSVVDTIPTPGFGEGLGSVSLAANSLNDSVYVQDDGITDEGCTPPGSSCSPLFVISAPTNTVTGSVSLGPDDSGNYPFKAAVDPATDTIYVTDPATSSTYVINGTTDTVTATIPDGASPVGVAVDPRTNTVYVSDVSDNVVYTISGSSHEVTSTIPVGHGPAGIAVDPVTDCVYVANSEDSTVSVIAPSGNLSSCTATPQPELYAETFTESGLAPGTPWYVNVTGEPSAGSTTSTIVIDLPNGTYPYTVATQNKSWGVSSAVPPSPLVVDGSAVSVALRFSLLTYTVTFTTIPTTCGSITFNSTAYSDGESAQETVGSYAVSAQACLGYTTESLTGSGGVTVSSGAATVSGAGGVVVTFSPLEYAVNFTTRPTTCGTITFDGTAYSDGGSLMVAAGSYAVSVATCPGYTLESLTGTGGVTVSSGTATVSGAGGVVATFSPLGSCNYTITFHETGLAPGTTWGITLRGTWISPTTMSTTVTTKGGGGTLTFVVPCESYDWNYTFTVTPPARYTAAPSSGLVGVAPTSPPGTEDYQTIAFALTRCGLFPTLTSPDAQADGGFGTSVAISGTTVVVGASGEMASGYTDAGHAYVCNAETGRLISTLTSPNAQAGGGFGFSVAISGTTVVVGAPFETAGGSSEAGHAYVFKATTGALVSVLTSPNAQTDGYFGYSVAISGTTVVVGARQTASGYLEAGHAYVFKGTTGALIATLTSPNAQADGDFGFSVAVSGTTVVVGALYETASGDADAGHAYVFKATTGALIATLTSPNVQANGDFGASVAVSGTTAVVGADGETASGDAGAGHAYIFKAETRAPA